MSVYKSVYCVNFKTLRMQKSIKWGITALMLCCNAQIMAQLPTTELAKLSEIVQETSGLLLLDNVIITHNDSGNSPLLYQLDSSDYNVKRSFQLLGVSNTDWEDLAEDNNFIYVGDFGNNRGSRADLKILKVAKDDFWNKDAAFPQVIEFKYEDQIDFEDTSNNDWDAEALVSWGDSLLLFTKERKSGGAAAYSLPKTPGKYEAKRTAYIPNVALITGATRMSGDSGIALVGYTSLLQPFVVLIGQESGRLNLTSGIQRRYLTLSNGQSEGICALPNGNLLVSTENFNNEFLNLPAAVYLVVLQSEESTNEGGESTEDTGEGGVTEPDFQIWYEPKTGSLDYNLELNYGDPLSRAIFDLAGRRVIYEENPNTGSRAIDLSALRTAVYYLVLNFKDRIVSRSFVRY